MNEQIMNGKWQDIKGEIQKTWGKITGDELEQAKGNLTSISGLIQQRYGIAKEEASNKLDQLVQKFDSKAEEVKQSLRKPQ